MQFSVFLETTGKILMAMEVPTIDAAIDNLMPGQLLIEGWYDGDTHYVAAGVATPRPTIPMPIEDGNYRRWPDPPPPGLRARVYDRWIDPPHLLIDTPLSAPDCGLHLAEGGAGYLIELAADFPWLPRSLEVAP